MDGTDGRRDAVWKEPSVNYVAAEPRYQTMTYARTGRSGLKLPKISLGLWQNFGDDRPDDGKRAMLLGAFDRGITHFDLANNYGPPPGSAEQAFGRIYESDLKPYRDELILSTKAGYRMWDGPYGEWGSRKNLLASLDRSLARMRVEYVDIFYHHRPDPDTPLEETMGALDHAVRSGKALYAGLSNYNADDTARATAILGRLGTPCLIHQPRYSMLERWVEGGLLEVLETQGIGSIAFSPLGRGQLTPKYLDKLRAELAAPGAMSAEAATPDRLSRLSKLDVVARRRGQSLPQLALSWVLRGQVTSALIGASSLEQIIENLAALDAPALTAEELSEIDTLTDGLGNFPKSYSQFS